MASNSNTLNSLPIQYTPFRKEDLQSDGGIAFFNQQLQQIVNAVNIGQGHAGKVVIPNGIDVNGATISGVGTPKAPSDAVSQGHAESNYSAPAVAPKLDIGGPNALKGLTGVTIQANKSTADVTAIQAQLAAGVSGTITIPKLTGGGTNGSITVTGGIITAFVNPT